MGVPGLWEILNHAGESRALAHLALLDGFDRNPHGSRSFRLGIDAGLWLRHALHSAGPAHDDRGAAPAIRTLFFRLCRLSRFPFSLLFVFDGRDRPKEKRGSRLGKSGTHHLAPLFQKLIAIFGMSWREAKGEAEAELARLNYLGHIDAVLTDDSDIFLFGARMVLKNVSLKLTGNKAHPAVNANGKPCSDHASVYTADAFKNHPEVRLSRGGMILIALIAGGDYDKGIFGLGLATGHALARLGYGDRLLDAYTRLAPAEFRAWLPGWRAAMTLEIQTNASGLLSSRRPSASIPPSFPAISTLASYAHPAVFATGGGAPADACTLDLPALAAFCEAHFTEWGHRAAILARFPTLVYPGVVHTVFRRAALIADAREENRRIAAGALPGEARVRAGWSPTPAQAVGTPAALVNLVAAPAKQRQPQRRADTVDARMRGIAGAFVNRGAPEPERAPGPAPEPHINADEAALLQGAALGAEAHPLVVAIHRSRQHVSTDGILEYAVEICVEQLVALTERGINGTHPEPAAGSSRGRGKGKSTTKGKGKGRATARAEDWRPNMNPGRRSKRYEDTESESEAPEPVPVVDDDDGEDDDGVDAPRASAARKKKPADPRANIVMWIPASVVRHVHPELVAEFEERQAAQPTKTKKAAPRKRAAPAAAGVPAQDAPVAVRPTQDAAGPVPAAAPPRAKPAAPRASKAKGKGKVPKDDEEEAILRANPHASFAPPTATAAEARSASAEPAAIARASANAAPPPPSASVSTNVGSRKGKERAAPEPQNPPQPVAPVPPARLSRTLPEPDGWGLYDDFLLAQAGGSKRKFRTSIADSPAKRRKTTPGVSLDDALYRISDSSDSEPDMPWQRPRASQDRLSSPVSIPRCSSPVLGPPPSSSPAATPSRSVSSRRSVPLDADVISISSDSEDGEAAQAAGSGSGLDNDDRQWWMLPPFNGQPSLYSQRKAASSRASLPSAPGYDDDAPMAADAEDLWAEPSASAATPRGRALPREPATVKASRVAQAGASSSARSSGSGVRGRRGYRGEAVPSSSQESMLYDDEFFGDASVLVDMS